MALSALPVLALLGGCRSSDAGSVGPLDEITWTLAGPEVSIGSVDRPEHAFQAVVALAIGPDGSIYSLHRAEAAIRHWSPDGTPLETIGREGEGPGEFRSPRSMGFFGDTLWVYDSRSFRVNYFLSDGTYLDSNSLTVDLGSANPNEAVFPTRPERPLRDGTLLGSTPGFSDEIARGTLTRGVHVHMDGDGAVMDTTWVREWRTTDILALLRDGGGTFMQQPFDDQPLTSLVERDESYVIVDRRAWDGQGDPAVSVTRVDVRTGDTLSAAKVPYAARPLSSSQADSAMTALAEQMQPFMVRREPDLTVPGLAARFSDGFYRPAWVPAVTELALAEDGRILLKPFDQPADADVWWVLDPLAEPLGSVRVPKGLESHRVTGEHVWGVMTDELDVNYIVKLPLRPSA